MTSLKTFQADIQDIHQRELAKQRNQPQIADTKGKENQNPTTSKGKAKDNVPSQVDRTDMFETEDKILVIMCSVDLSSC